MSDEFLKATMNVDYFSNISNSDGDFDNWGMFATEGGKSTNRQNMLEIIRQMAEELKPEYFISDKAVYSKIY